MGIRNFSFETSIERLGRILASQYNIQVTFEGNQAYTDGKRIVLPHFEKMSEELKGDLNGYLDHEVGHCKFTTFDSMSKAKGRMHKELLNAIEDVRIERAMIEEFPGCAMNIGPLNDKLRVKLAEKWAELPWTVRIILGIRDLMEGKAPRIDSDIERYVDVVKESAIALNDCKNTEEIRVLTEEIMKKIIDEREEEKKEGDEDEKGDSKGEKEGDDESSKGDESGESESSSGAGEGSDGEEEGEDADGSGDSDAEGKDGSGRGSSSSSVDPKYDDMLTEKVGKEGSEFDKHVTDVHSMMKDEIEDAIDESMKKPRTKSTDPLAPEWAGELASVPCTTRFDRVTDHSGKGNRTQYAALKREVMPQVLPIKTHLERVLKVKENAKWRHEREHGSVDARQLGRLVATQNRYTFKDFTKTETNNVAVELLVDMSGSMSGRMDTAKAAVIAMAEALKSLDIPFEVTGFYSEPDRKVSEFFTSLPEDSKKRFNRRRERLELHIFKGFESPTLTGIEALFVGAQNPDGECVAWAAKRLAARTEKRKILIVLSDGEPATGDANRAILCSDLRRKVKQITKSGIECVGIGIQTECVKNFYPDFIVLNNIEELAKGTMSKLARLLEAV